jgi:hypothetical protein
MNHTSAKVEMKNALPYCDVCRSLKVSAIDTHRGNIRDDLAARQQRSRVRIALPHLLHKVLDSANPL